MAPLLTVAEKRREIERVLTETFEEGPRIEELCEGTSVCRCAIANKPVKILDRSKYTYYGVRNKATRAANAAYMREYRERKKRGTA